MNVDQYLYDNNGIINGIDNINVNDYDNRDIDK